MGAISAKLRSQEGNLFAHWCPGCDQSHGVPSGRGWTWDGNVDAPTVQPSINYPGHCHYFIAAGNLIFQPDCHHELAGKTVPLPDWPA